MKRNIHLKEAKAYQNIGGNWFMSLTYSYDDTDGRHELIYPKVEFPVTVTDIPNIQTTYSNEYFGYSMFMSAFDAREVYNGVPSDPRTGKTLDTCRVIDILVEPKVQAMTVEEIEKELGYKVNIVSK